ncbi:MAG: hypothetical protein IKR48_13890 [Kiritimatiellae bacterium]|nr:hypothetical protein [Kiritimatiellia bacterium]
MTNERKAASPASRTSPVRPIWATRMLPKSRNGDRIQAGGAMLPPQWICREGRQPMRSRTVPVPEQFQAEN